MRISIFEAFSAGKKCALYTGKYGMIVGQEMKPTPHWWKASALTTASTLLF